MWKLLVTGWELVPHVTLPVAALLICLMIRELARHARRLAASAPGAFSPTAAPDTA